MKELNPDFIKKHATKALDDIRGILFSNLVGGLSKEDANEMVIVMIGANISAAIHEHEKGNS